MTIVNPGRISSADVADFLVAQGFPAVSSLDGRLPSGPDELVAITRTGGPGFSLEGALDNVTFHFAFRGAQNDPISCEDMAWAVDQMLEPPPLSPPLGHGMIGSQYVTQVTRVGGAPSYQSIDTARRVTYTCDYIFSVSRLP